VTAIILDGKATLAALTNLPIREARMVRVPAPAAAE